MKDQILGIVGTGNVGGTLGVQLSNLGYRIIFGERSPGASKLNDLLKKAPSAERLPIAGLAAEVDLLILATPWNAVEEVLQAVGNLQGKVLIDAVNPIIMGGPEELSQGLLVGHSTSAAEKIAEWAPGSKVVKCFNMIGAQIWPILFLKDRQRRCFIVETTRLPKKSRLLSYGAWLRARRHWRIENGTAP